MLQASFGRERASVEAVTASFRAFRGEKAECYLAADRHKLLGVDDDDDDDDCEGRVGGEERGVPETRQCGYRATPRYHAKTSNHPSPPHRRAACRRRCRRAGALMQR